MNTVKRTEYFWLQSRIPVKYRQDSIKKLEKLFVEWNNLKKSKGRRTGTQMNNEQTFLEKVENLFDIAHANAMAMITENEDKLFLEYQRKKGRPGRIGGLDTITMAKEKKKQDRLDNHLARHKTSEHEKKILSEIAILTSSTSSSSEEETSNILGLHTSDNPTH